MDEIENIATGNPIISLIITILAIIGAYQLYKWYKKMSSNSNELSSGSSTAEKPTLDELQNELNSVPIDFKPHKKGVWNDDGKQYATEAVSGQKYLKDEPLELYSVINKYSLYYARYKGNTCYFPVNLISEGGRWI